MLTLSPDQPLLVFGGPYSNRHALEAVQAIAAREGIAPSHVICTGDVVAYCGDPAACVDAVRAWDCHVVAGNCEEQMANGGDDCGCGFEAGTACDLLSRNWYAYASQRIDDDARRWMAGLPTSLRLRYGAAVIDVVHGGFAANNRFLFASDAGALRDELATTTADIVLAGHCGIPFARSFGPQLWFNPGVIGMPANDGTADGWYGIVRAERDDAGGWAYAASIERLTYDAQGAADATHRGGHAEPYARALTCGLWPSLDVLPAEERAATGQPLTPRRVTHRLPMRQAASAQREAMTGA
ncbi:MAG: metallophosphoesterase family protein [Pseudomonadota bacterium]